MTANGFGIQTESVNSETARHLLDAAEAELRVRYPEDVCHSVDLVADRAAFYVAYLDGIPVGCGALREIGPGTAEIKRMFVDAAARGRGVGRRLLRHLMAEALALGYREIFLETGTRQPEAVALYESEGFTPVPCGEQQIHPLSLCYARTL